MSQHKQSGFAVVELLLTLILLAIVGFTGYYVWHSQKQTDKTLNTTDKSSAVTTKPKTTASAQQYLTIKEWGVKIPLSADLAGAYYTTMPSVPGAVYLSVDAYKGTDCAADQTSLGALNRFTATDKDDDGNTLLSDSPTAVKVGTYYYDYLHPQAACDGRTTNSTAGFDAAAANKASGLMADFKNAASKIVTAN